jgi:NADH-quinone oxidoreductase subunit N
VIAPPEISPTVLAPIGFTAIGAMLILVQDALLTRGSSLLGRRVTPAYAGTLNAATAVLFLSLAFYVTLVAYASGDTMVFQLANPLYQQDRFSSFATALLVVVGILTCALSVSYLSELGVNHGAYYALVLISITGAIFLVGAIDLLSVYIGLELMTIPVYALAGFDRARLRSNEAAIKYFVMGSFATAILLYGMALTYGATGTTSFGAIRDAFDPTNPVAMLGLSLMMIGFGFKVASVPFHQWAPDVYEGAPAPITAYMSVAVKAAAFMALLRLVATAIGPETEQLSDVFATFAMLSMIVGNLMAVIQENVKRMLAYSSIGHAGALMVGLATGSPGGYTAIAFYLVVYSFMNFGAFAVVIILARHGRECEKITDFAGLARTRPGLAAAMTLFMLSLAGIPGTAGFMAKFNLIVVAMRADMIWLPVSIVVTSVISLFYCLRIPALMMMHEPSGPPPRMAIATGEALALCFCAAVVLFLGFFPNHGMLPWIGLELPVLDWANDSVTGLFGS